MRRALVGIAPTTCAAQYIITEGSPDSTIIFIAGGGSAVTAPVADRQRMSALLRAAGPLFPLHQCEALTLEWAVLPAQLFNLKREA